MKTLFCLLVFISASLPAFAQPLAEVSKKIQAFITHDCVSLTGDAKNAEVKELDKLKNRSDIPQTSDFDKSVSLPAMMATGNDKERFKVGKAAEIIGYVEDIHAGGIETCNCHTKDDILRDAHINLVLDPMKSTLPIIVEVSPRFRKIMADKGVDWTTRSLRDKFKGRWVKVQGWLFYDKEHEPQAVNTALGSAKPWRQSVWELHPVTSMEVTERPRETFNQSASTPTTSTEKATPAPITSTDKEVGEYKGHKIYQGTRGGKYYLNDKGNKTYIK